MPALFALMPVGLLVYGNLQPMNTPALVLAAAALVVAIVRMAYTFSNTLRVTAEATAAALTDALTGLGNRRALLAELDAELADAPETDSTVLVMFDLDGFKDYNDTFGHPAGDALLVRLGRRLDAGGRRLRLGLQARRRRVLRSAAARTGPRRRRRGAAPSQHCTSAARASTFRAPTAPSSCRRRRATRPERSSSPTSGSTPRRGYGVGRRRPSRCATSCSRWSASGRPSCATTSTTWPCSPLAWAGASGCAPMSSTRWSGPPSSTTSGRWLSRTRS